MFMRSIADGQDLALSVAGLGMPVAVRRSQRAKRFTLKVSHTERTAILTLPDRGCLEDAGEFLARHFDWLKKQIEKIPSPVSIMDGAIIPLRGVSHRLSFVGSVRYRGVVWVEEVDKTMGSGRVFREAAKMGPPCSAVDPFVETPLPGQDLPRLCVAGSPEHAARRLIDWLRLEAKKDLFYRVHHHSANLGIYPKRISVRDQSTRWGSCSSNGNLSFSWRLIFAPSYVLDYVAAHEVAHLREMNHGPRFWRLVRETMPDMQRARVWLKRHGTELHRFNVATGLQMETSAKLSA